MFVPMLEIVTRRNGRFVKVQDVLVEGVQVATLTNIGTKHKPQWRLTWTTLPGEPLVFQSRDDALTYLYVHFTIEPPVGPFSLRDPIGSVDVLSDREAYEFRHEYDAWLDTLPSYEREALESA